MKEEVFPTTIWVEDVDIDSEHWSKVCIDWSKAHIGVKVSNHGGYQSEPHLHLEKPFKKILKVIMEHVKELINDVDALKFNGLWFNINRYLDYNEMHMHVDYFTGDITTGCLYLRVPNDSGLFIAEDPRPLNLGSDRIFVTPKTGRLTLFPTWLKHAVLPNLNKTEMRISMAFNIGIK